jgi:hypothetical protein
MKELFLVLSLVLLTTRSGLAVSLRQVIPLDGTWQIAEGTMTNVPAAFERKAPVPGLVDMAMPSFAEVGVPSTNRAAFWYRRTFEVTVEIPESARLKINKAMFGNKVLLNGKALGESDCSFTPTLLDAKGALKKGENELVIRVGAYPADDKKSIGWDLEKTRYVPGVFDSVELLLSGAPVIERVQAVPDIEAKVVTVYTYPAQAVTVVVREAHTGKQVGKAEGTGPLTIPLRRCRLWSPEDPFLYELTVSTAGDELTTRFGMRSFRLDPATGHAVLNGKPYFMRGSNITLYRFFEDDARKGLPWDEKWVRTLHERVKEMHWNSLRYCIGFPPEFWYRIADEVGLLIQDEFPIWMPFVKPGELHTGALVEQYFDWMQERWNHPCVVVWDASNETNLPEIETAYNKVRTLDFSDRPWDNGWRKPSKSSDSCELHPYHFMEHDTTLEVLGLDDGLMRRKPGESPIINNEYGWLWLNRDGTPTRLTEQLYATLLGTNSTTEVRRMTYARYLAAETEFWRAHRGCAAVLHFCALGYSRAGGQTSDHWADLETLAYEPLFYRYVRDAFAPVGVMIDNFKPFQLAGQTVDFPLIVINDPGASWKGLVRVELLKDGKAVSEKTLPVALEAYGKMTLPCPLQMPAEPGGYQVRATLLKTPAGDVCSLRDFTVLTAEQRVARNGIAVGKPATASSIGNRDSRCGAQMDGYVAAAAVDGSLLTHWEANANKPDPQWLAIDLQATATVSRVELVWKKHFAKRYAIQVSTDGRAWTDVVTTDEGKGGVERHSFAPVPARWVRFYVQKRADRAGYQIQEFRVFGK